MAFYIFLVYTQIICKIKQQNLIISKQIQMRNLTFFLVLCLIYTIKAQVLGIDFGTQFWKAALISPGKNLVIVENSRSQRKTLNSIAFQEGIRFFEDDSKSKRLKKPQLSYFYLNKLIRSLDTKQPLQGFEFVDGTYVFEAGDKSMTLEQVVGMILKNIKQLASLQAGTQIRDVVLSVPSNWGFHAKMSLVNAANLADFSVLGLINQNSAAAIQFAISRNDTDPINVILFNYGSHNLQLSTIKAFGYFDESKNKTIESIQVLSHVAIQDIGGLKVDEAIANYLAKQFQKKHKVDPTKNKKSYVKLLMKASQAKQTLSANKQTQVYIEGLIDGIDLNLPLSRQVVEQCSHFNQFGNYLDQVITKAGLNKNDIKLVQIIGGASRIPKVSSVVREYFNKVQGVEVGSHINGDQAVAFGSALRAANLSLTFRVKQLHFYDAMNLDTKVIIASPDKGVILQQTLFHLSDHHGAKKSLTLAHNDEDVKITVYVGEQIVRQFATSGLGDWKKKHEKDNITDSPTLNIEFMMSSIHVAQIKDIYVNLTINVTNVREKVQYVDEEVQIQVQEQVKPEQQKQQSKEQKQQQKKEQAQEKAKGEAEETAEKKTKKKVNKTKTVKKLVEQHEIRPKKHTTSFEQTFSKYKRFSKDEADEKRKLLHQYQAHQKGIKQKAKLRNDFQSALYGLKNSFEQQYLKTFSKEKQLQHLINTVTTELQWLDQNAWTATKEAFEEHFKILSQAYNPIHNRSTQYRNREKTYNETMSNLGMVYQRANDLLTSHHWIKQKVQNHLKKINQTAEWIANRIKQQIEKPLNQNPVFYNHEMVQKAEQLRNQYYMLKMTPRPKIDDFMKEFKKKYAQEERKKKQQEEKQQKQNKKQEKAEQQEQSQENQGQEQQEGGSNSEDL